MNTALQCDVSTTEGRAAYIRFTVVQFHHVAPINKGGETMTWEIVLGIIALAGFVGTIAAYAGKQGSVLAKLEATLKALNKTLEDLKENNRTAHKEIYDRLTDHDGRIARLESKHEHDDR